MYYYKIQLQKREEMVKVELPIRSRKQAEQLFGEPVRWVIPTSIVEYVCYVRNKNLLKIFKKSIDKE